MDELMWRKHLNYLDDLAKSAEPIVASVEELYPHRSLSLALSKARASGVISSEEYAIAKTYLATRGELV